MDSPDTTEIYRFFMKPQKNWFEDFVVERDNFELIMSGVALSLTSPQQLTVKVDCECLYCVGFKNIYYKTYISSRTYITSRNKVTKQ